MTRRIGISMCVGLVAACLTTTAAAQGTMRQWRATELWRVDGTEGGEPYGDLRDFVIGRDGALWVLDFKDQSIRRYDANGRPLGAVGRKGSGPGEMRNANGMVTGRDGSVWLNDPSNARLTVFGGDGKFVRQVVLPGSGYGYRWNAWLDRKTGDVIDAFINQGGGASSMQWRRVSEAGAIRDTFPIVSCAASASTERSGFKAETKGKGAMSSSYPFTIGGGLAPDGNGAAWCATALSTRAALVRVAKRDTILQTQIELARVPVLEAERDAEIARVEKSIARYAVSDFDASKIPASKPPIASLVVDDDGRLWVRHTSRGGETFTTFDIHDGAGQHLGRLRIPHPTSEWIPLHARGNDVWVAVRDADDVVSIARYRINK